MGHSGESEEQRGRRQDAVHSPVCCGLPGLIGGTVSVRVCT